MSMFFPSAGKRHSRDRSLLCPHCEHRTDLCLRLEFTKVHGAGHSEAECFCIEPHKVLDCLDFLFQFNLICKTV